ncbi:mechanosensitive ion channel domain-containing protein [Methylomonas sp. AM2-LC]|uniref:mechanosensitive ion channel domain-containing protein n=1 Tax=Methylomonas sp. AM2-LC TaxID=3153301 RepID=UPI00326602E4
MKQLLFIIVWLYATTISVTQAVANNGTEQVLQSDKAATSVPKLPDPAKLATNWWLFFVTDPALLKDRIEQFAQELKRLQPKLLATGKADTQANLDRLKTNLLTYLDVRSKTALKTPAEITLQNTYTIEEWLDIVHQQRTLDMEIQSAQEDLLIDENQIKATEQRFDSQTAAYQQADTKLTPGIVLMATWAKFATQGEQLRLQKQALAANNMQLAQLTQAATTAEERLFISATYLQQLKKELFSKEQEFNNAHAILIHLETASDTGKGNGDEIQAYKLLFEQRIRNATISAAIANTVFSREKIQQVLAQLLVSKNNVEPQALSAELHDNRDNISQINARLGVWRPETEREQSRASKSLAALLIANVKQNNVIVKLTQQRLNEVQVSLLALQRLDSEIRDANLIADKAKALLTGQQSVMKNGLEDIKIFSAQTWKMLGNNLSTSLFKIGESPVTSLGIVRLLFIISMSWTLSHFVRRGLRHFSEWRHGSIGFIYTLSRLTHYLILIAGISIGLSSIGVDLSNFALIAGGLSLGIGFGLQAIFSNFVSGLIVLFERSLRIGDFVELSTGITGEVRAINVRSTLLTTQDMVEILVPNSEFVNGKVINWTLNDASRRFHIPFSVAYGNDKQYVREAALKAAAKSPHTLKDYKGREAEAWLIGFGDTSLNFELVVWLQPQAVKIPQQVRADYYWELETALTKQGIKLPATLAASILLPEVVPGLDVAGVK